MTEPRRFGIGWLSFAAFVLVLALLALQLRAGRDPALRHAKTSTAGPRRVLVRRIVRRVVVIHLVPPSDTGAPAAASTPVGSTPAAATPLPPPPPVPAPVTRSS